MSFTTLPVSNQKLTAATLGALITEARPISALKTSDGTTFASDTSLKNESGMSAAVAASTSYFFDAAVVYDAGTVADIKLAWTFPTASFYYTVASISTAGAYTPIVSTAEASGTAKSFGGLGIGTFGVVVYTGFIVVTTAGTLQLQRAQNSSTAENTRIKAGSWIRLMQAV
jgi:hypothetical protein